MGKRIGADRAERIITERSGIGRARCLECRQERKSIDLAMQSSWMTLNGAILVEKRARLSRIQGGWVRRRSNTVKIKREVRIQLEGKSEVMKSLIFVGERFYTVCRWIDPVRGRVRMG